MRAHRIRRGMICGVLAGLALGVLWGGTTSAGAAPRVERYDDGSAAVTLDSGLTIVLGRTVTHDVRTRTRNLQRVLDRHAQGSALRARAICAYARRLGRHAPACGPAKPRQRKGAEAQARTQTQPQSRQRQKRATPRNGAQPLATGLDGRTMDDNAQSPNPRRRARQPRAGSQSTRAQPNSRTPAYLQSTAQPQPRRRATPGRASRPERAATRPEPRPEQRRTTAQPGESTHAPRVPRTRGATLPRPADMLQSSSLSPNVTDPVASPSSLNWPRSSLNWSQYRNTLRSQD